jgi:hypothetical protein
MVLTDNIDLDCLFESISKIHSNDFPILLKFLEKTEYESSSIDDLVKKLIKKINHDCHDGQNFFYFYRFDKKIQYPIKNIRIVLEEDLYIYFESYREIRRVLGIFDRKKTKEMLLDFLSQLKTSQDLSNFDAAELQAAIDNGEKLYERIKDFSFETFKTDISTF